ncbi:PilN domain-containing protein [Marinobacter alexandrii]|uniref:PilN domain-containing protein n=1 Tax=Marinobacter alexandrii TaxID=2570351 RepID=UPI001109CCB0|nr:PilN domain-containing protein [Marinobacter alexandrii]
MTQQVNLYTQELRPRKETLQAGALVALVVLLVVALGLGSAVIRYHNSELEVRVNALGSQTETLEQNVVRLSEGVSARQPAPEIQDALDRVTEILVRRQELLVRVEGLILNDGGRFSPQMAALARQIPKDVWLTGIRLNAQPSLVTIEGRARSGALVPTYLENLGNEPVFTGQTFGAFRLTRPEEGRWIEFHVATKRAGENN